MSIDGVQERTRSQASWVSDRYVQKDRCAVRVKCGHTVHGLLCPAAITRDDVVPCVSRMRWVVNPELRVIPRVERFDPEFKRAAFSQREMLGQSHIKIRAAWVGEEIPASVAERQTRRGDKAARISQERPKSAS